MSNTHPRFTTGINGSPEIIFDLIADAPNLAAGWPVQKRLAGQQRCRHIRVRLGRRAEN